MKNTPRLRNNPCIIELAEGILTIKGEKKEEREEEDKGYYVRERSYGSFLRQIPVPFAVTEDKIEAKFENGVLSLTLPKPPEAEKKAKKIDIKTS